MGSRPLEPSGVLIASAETAYVTRLCQLIGRDRRFTLVGLVASGDDLAASASTPDVAVVDLLVPGMRSPEAVKVFKGRRPHCVVALRSSIDAPYLRSVAAEAGAEAFLVAGKATRELLDLVAAVVNDSAAQAAPVASDSTT